MKLKFKVQDYQSNAVNAVVDCFDGQPKFSGHEYSIDRGTSRDTQQNFETGVRNHEIVLSDLQLLKNIQTVQKRQGLSPSGSLTAFTAFDSKGQHKALKDGYKPGSPINLDIEMETGTGKTYCYIKTMFEMHERFGWSKFIVIVPSIAIREGVKKAFDITADHFAETYKGQRAQEFIYSSKPTELNNLEPFSSGAGINVMIINIQAFNAKGAENRRIYEELDNFQSRKPIDMIRANKPILILDEPQKMEGRATLEALPQFDPLMILRYSATHRTQHLKVHRLDAVDAYNSKLVKKIAVRGIQTKNLTGTDEYLYLENIETSPDGPLARIDMEVKRRSGEIKRELKRLGYGDDLYEKSGGLDQYRGYKITQIDAAQDIVEFSNGRRLFAGDVQGDVNEDQVRRIQIRETIRAHFEREKELFSDKIKVLSLFFIDEVKKYRDYSREDQKGDYARIFEEEYDFLKKEYLSQLDLKNDGYARYVDGIDPKSTHNGYFAIDKKKRMVDPSTKKKGEQKGLSDDVSAYDLILKDKERLLSFEEPTRFIFSHSALREGWDNPNVFTMCMLKHSDSTISRRQEVGRGLRLSVNQYGERIDTKELVHKVNVLTVVASESYENFAKGLQTEIFETLSSRPRKANKDYFKGETIKVDGRKITITEQMAADINYYLIVNGYVDRAETITEKYHQDKYEGIRPAFPEEIDRYRDQIFDLVDGVFDDKQVASITVNGRGIKPNRLNPKNFHKKEFKELWKRINRKAIYQVDFDSDELIRNAVRRLDKELITPAVMYHVQRGEQTADVTDHKLRTGEGFKVTSTVTETGMTFRTSVTYDLVGKIALNTRLTRKTVANILIKISKTKFDQFQKNPEYFISEVSRIIIEQKANTVLEKLQYNATSERYENEIFYGAELGVKFVESTSKLKKHIYEYCEFDSKVEGKFVGDLDNSEEIIVYAKLPRGFLIPTPMGDYNPDWAISFKNGTVSHLYFLAETKGSMSSLQLRGIEKAKIKCAQKFFDELNKHIESDKVKYDVVDGYDSLINIVKDLEPKRRNLQELKYGV